MALQTGNNQIFLYRLHTNKLSSPEQSTIQVLPPGLLSYHSMILLRIFFLYFSVISISSHLCLKYDSIIHFQCEFLNLFGSGYARLGYVHISDSNLKYTGAGHIDFISVMQTLKEIDYRGYISLECLPYPDAYVVAERSLNFIKSIEQLTMI